jgi:hypothetical protein
MLEDYLAANYGSQGVIHLTKGFALQALSLDLLETTGNGTRLVTKLGTPVAAGAGYPGTAPGGAAAGPNATWAYASPALFGYRSEVFTPDDTFDHAHNELTSLAGRSYLFGFDPCGVGAVKVATVAP